MDAFTGPIRVQPIADRLKAQVDSLAFIGRAPDLEYALDESNPATPAAYVTLGLDEPGPRQGTTTMLVQVVRCKFSVALAVRDYSAAQRSGPETEDELSMLLRQIRGALLRWRHPEAATETVLGGLGQPFKIDKGVLWWQDVYELTYQIRL